VIREFWERFLPQLDLAEKQAFVPKIETDIPCPSCESGKLQKVWFKNKYFFGCTNYPECTFSAPIETVEFNKDDYAEDFDWDQKCPTCQSEMKLRHSRFGSFLGCSKYPECKGIVNIPKKGEHIVPDSELPPCPAIDCPGKIVSRKSRSGKIFYSCSTFPECDVIANSVELLAEKYQNHTRTAYVKKERYAKKGKATKEKAPAKKKAATKKKAPPKTKREAKSLSITGPLKDFLGTDAMSRGNVTKAVWAYIKEKDLQDPKDKRSILPDSALAKVLGTTEPVNMFKLAGLLGKYIE
jgi:DNA topoisomerase-1